MSSLSLLPLQASQAAGLQSNSDESAKGQSNKDVQFKHLLFKYLQKVYHTQTSTGERRRVQVQTNTFAQWPQGTQASYSESSMEGHGGGSLWQPESMAGRTDSMDLGLGFEKHCGVSITRVATKKG